MPGIAENSSERLTFKAYASADITAGSEPAIASDPGASGGQVLRYVSQNLSLQKDAFRADEIRTDRQAPMGRHGMRRVPGQISGLLSPLTYGDLFQAVLRGTWAAAVTKTEVQLTSVAFSNAASTMTFAGGDPVTEGFRVGDPVIVTNITGNNLNKRFIITGFSGASNRTVGVYPAPEDLTADLTFTITATKSLIIPASAHVKRKYAFEVYNSDIDLHRLFTECRLGGCSLAFPANGNATCGFNVFGRNRVVASSASSPFFTAPTAATTTDIIGPVGGLLRVDGQNLGVLTGLNFGVELSPGAPPVVGTDLAPDIFLGSAVVTGELSAFLEDADLLDDFSGENEIELLAYGTTSDAANTPGMTFYMPRIVLNSNDETPDGSGGKLIRCSFQAARYTGAAAGIESTTIRICDTEQT